MKFTGKLDPIEDSDSFKCVNDFSQLKVPLKAVVPSGCTPAHLGTLGHI